MHWIVTTTLSLFVFGTLSCQSSRGAPQVRSDGGKTKAHPSSTPDAPGAGPTQTATAPGPTTRADGATLGRTPDGGLFIPPHWTVVPEADFAPSNCRVYQSLDDPPYPALAWQACGDDCEVSDVTQGISSSAIASAASNRHGAAYAYFSHSITEGARRGWINRLVRLRDGVTLAALGVDFKSAVCEDSYERQSALIQFHDAGESGHDRRLYGIVSDPPATFVWASPAAPTASVPQGLVAFDTSNRLFTLGMGGVYALKPPENTWTTIEKPSTALYGAGAGDLAAWVESDSARVRAWAPDGNGVRTVLEQAPKTTCMLALSEQAIVGVAGDACLGASNGVRVWTMGLRADAGTIRVSPAIKGRVFATSPSGVRTSGQYAAIQLWSQSDGGAAQGPPFFFVVDLSSWRVWKVESLPGYLAQDSMWTLDDTYLYWGEVMKTETAPLAFHRMVRVRLDGLDKVGKRI